MASIRIGITIAAYLWFGYHYADALIKESKVIMFKPKAQQNLIIFVVTVTWPVWVMVQLASMLGRL